jgi:hypothetical protein
MASVTSSGGSAPSNDVIPRDEHGTALRAQFLFGPVDTGRREERFALAADAARRQAPFEFRLCHLEHDCPDRAVGDHAFERFGLDDGARKPIEDKPAGSVRLSQPIANERDHHLVADQSSGGQD